MGHIEHGEHDITYVPRQAIKGQALTDFLVETSIPDVLMSTPILAPSSPRHATAKPPDYWHMYVDGASGKAGSGAGVLLVSLEKKELTYALRFQFATTNNEVEYEALLAGLRIATDLKVNSIRIYSNSQVIVNHMLRKYEAKGERMKKYLAKAQNMQKAFSYFQLERIPRAQNSRADVLSRLTAAPGSSPIEDIQHRIIEEAEVNDITEEDQPTWMTPLLNYLVDEELPEDKIEARRILAKLVRYAVMTTPFTRSHIFNPYFGVSAPPRRTTSCARCMKDRVAVTLDLGQWPKRSCDGVITGPRCSKTELVQRCEKCQLHANVTRVPQSDLVAIQSPWPFAQCRIDIVGPFKKAPGQLQCLIVAIDYFTKWVEAEPLAMITSKNARNFVWKNMVCRFGIPHVLVSDNGTQFTDKIFRD